MSAQPARMNGLSRPEWKWEPYDPGRMGGVFEIVLHNPQIPPNTGNIIRLCANTGARLHLVEPLGFDLSDKQLKRAGLDYHDLAHVQTHRSWAELKTSLSGGTWYALSTRGRRSYAEVKYEAGDVLVFGAEPSGLPDEILSEFPAEQALRIPMVAGSRSLNLSNSAAIVLYEAWRQADFASGS